MKKNILIVLLIALSVFIYFRQDNKNYYDMINAVSGATPLAIDRDTPEGVSLNIDGLVKQEYQFNASALNGFASTRIRTKEFSPDGEYLGAYAYAGIPVFNILEGIAPEKRPDAVFNQPLDILIKFISASGESVGFTFNEIIMADDSLPVTLAYYREPVKPTADSVKDTYDKNIMTEPLKGLRLIAPAEPDITRYLDNVVKITYATLPAPDDLLPARTKGPRCASSKVTCIDERNTYQATFENVPRIKIDDWVLIGHGHGYEENVKAEGFALRPFLKENFKGITPDDYFLFVACDGYRCLFSYREIFAVEKGKDMMIVDIINDELPETGFRLAPTADFFTDRSMWGLAYVVRLTPQL
ncbi:MAG: hypothetical protein JXL81_07720 [Deltaproteobacteria bacterium]|nr:hypothetical protein [Deltaproteobacteria bacterium]